MSDMVLVDIWGGFEACEYKARYIRPIEEALKIVETEILKGFLCNVRVLNETEAKEWVEWDSRSLQ